jgi:hypothetical protein
MSNTCKYNNNIYDLCFIILEDQFPEEVAKIGKELLSYGPSSIQELVKKIGLEFISIRNALIVLVQNRMVRFQEVQRKDCREFLYELDIESVFNVIRYPKILYHISQKYGENGILIFQEFMQYGVLSFNQCIEQIKYQKTKASANYINTLKSSFITLIQNNFLIQSVKVRNEEIKPKKGSMWLL